MKCRGVGLVVVALALTACGGSSSSGPEPPSVEEYLDDLIEVSAPINKLCIVLEAKAQTDDQLPELLDCKRDESLSEVVAITTVWEDSAYNAAMNDLEAPDLLFAPPVAVAVADLFAANESSFSDVNLLVFVLNYREDRCYNIIMMPAPVAIKLGNGEITPVDALNESLIRDTGC